MFFDLNIMLILLVIVCLILENPNKKYSTGYIILAFFSLYFITNIQSFFNTNWFILSDWKLLFLALIFIIFIIITQLIETRNFDIYSLTFLVFIGSVILIASDNLITLYLGLELQTFSVFILVAKNRLSIKSSEAGLKYFILGAISSGFFLLGLTVLFLSGASLNLKDVLVLSKEMIVNLSIMLILLSFCFKLSLFPLHFWIPDIYEGSSWDIVSLVSTLPKISVITILIQLMINSNLILSFSIISIIIGTLGSLNQTKTKRLLAYSGISHMGFIILGYSLLSYQGFIISTLYLGIYMTTMICLFTLIISINFNSKYIIELSDLKYVNKLFSVSFILLILSIAGIPPLSGFISKWFLLWTTVTFNYDFASFIMILFSAIAAGYYLRFVKIIYFQKRSSFLLWESIIKKERPINEFNLLVIGLLFFFSLFLLINFSFIIDIINLNSIIL